MPLAWSPETYRGAEGRYPPVAGTDSQVVKGNGLPVQLHILSDPQHPLHRRDHKLPWVLPRRGCSEPGMAGSRGKPLASPCFLYRALLTGGGWPAGYAASRAPSFGSLGSLGRVGARGTDSCSGCRCSWARLDPSVPETPVWVPSLGLTQGRD